MCRGEIQVLPFHPGAGEPETDVQLTLEVAITDTEGESKSDTSTIEDQCAGVVEQRFDEAVEFSALTRNSYNRRL